MTALSKVHYLLESRWKPSRVCRQLQACPSVQASAEQNLSGSLCSLHTGACGVCLISASSLGKPWLPERSTTTNKWEHGWCCFGGWAHMLNGSCWMVMSRFAVLFVSYMLVTKSQEQTDALWAFSLLDTQTLVNRNIELILIKLVLYRICFLCLTFPGSHCSVQTLHQVGEPRAQHAAGTESCAPGGGFSFIFLWC